MTGLKKGTVRLIGHQDEWIYESPYVITRGYNNGGIIIDLLFWGARKKMIKG